MTKVRITARAGHLDPVHAVTEILVLFHYLRGNRLVVAGPAAAGIKLGIGVKQCRIAADAVVYPGGGIAVVGTGKRAFGSLQATDLELRLGQLLAPLGFTLADLVHEFTPDNRNRAFTLAHARRMMSALRALREVSNRLPDTSHPALDRQGKHHAG